MHQHPLDYIYNALNIRIVTLNEKSDVEYKLIKTYVNNSLEKQNFMIKNIFAIER